MKTLESRRTYDVMCVANGVQDIFRTNLNEIIDNTGRSEAIYAMQEIIDLVLDLTHNESIYFQPSRDDESSKGLIIRIK